MGEVWRIRRRVPSGPFLIGFALLPYLILLFCALHHSTPRFMSQGATVQLFFGMPSLSFCPEAFSAAGGAENALLPTCRSQMAAVREFGRSAARFQQQAGALPVLTCRSPLSYTGI